MNFFDRTDSFLSGVGVGITIVLVIIVAVGLIAEVIRF